MKTKRYKKWCVGILYLFNYDGLIRMVGAEVVMKNAKQQWLFTATIDGNDSWPKGFQSINDYNPLIYEIFKIHNIGAGEIENLTPRTNASHCASLRSVLLPGYVLVKLGLHNVSEKWFSIRLNTGIQYLPVLSITTT